MITGSLSLPSPRVVIATFGDVIRFVLGIPLVAESVNNDHIESYVETILYRKRFPSYQKK